MSTGAGPLSSLGLSFLMSKMDTILVATSQGCGEGPTKVLQVRFSGCKFTEEGSGALFQKQVPAPYLATIPEEGTCLAGTSSLPRPCLGEQGEGGPCINHGFYFLYFLL